MTAADTALRLSPNKIHSANGLAATAYTYSTLGQNISRTLPDVFGSSTVTQTYEYDDANQLYKARIPKTSSGSACTEQVMVYDRLGRVIKVLVDNTVVQYNFYDGYSTLPSSQKTDLDNALDMAYISDPEKTAMKNALSADRNARGKSIATVSVNTLDGIPFYCIDAVVYDQEGRAYATFKTIPNMPIQKMVLTFDFMDRVVQKDLYKSTDATAYKTWCYTFDNNGRLATIYDGPIANGVKAITLEYDALGKVTRKRFQQANKGSATYDIPYQYTIRDWISAIGDSATSMSKSNGYFERINYTNGPGTPQYNGNISSAKHFYGTTKPMLKKYGYDGELIESVRSAICSQGLNGECFLNPKTFRTDLGGPQADGVECLRAQI